MPPATSSAAPPRAIAMPARKAAPNLWPKKSQAPKATNTGARLTSSVEVATEVSPRDRCQRAKVPPRNSPDANSARRSRGPEGRPGSPERRPSISIHAHRIGRARRTRQKAVATGPTSLVLTKIGAKAMAAAPASSAAKARPAWAAGAGLPLGSSSRGRAASPPCSARRCVLTGSRGRRLEGRPFAGTPAASDAPSAPGASSPAVRKAPRRKRRPPRVALASLSPFARSSPRPEYPGTTAGRLPGSCSPLASSCFLGERRAGPSGGSGGGMRPGFGRGYA